MTTKSETKFYKPFNVEFVVTKHEIWYSGEDGPQLYLTRALFGSRLFVHNIPFNEYLQYVNRIEYLTDLMEIKCKNNCSYRL